MCERRGAPGEVGGYVPDAAAGVVVVESVLVVVPGQLQGRGAGHVGHEALQLHGRPFSVKLLPQLHAALVQDLDRRLCWEGAGVGKGAGRAVRTLFSLALLGSFKHIPRHSFILFICSVCVLITFPSVRMP